MFSHEVHFHSSGFINKQNCQTCGSKNPKVKNSLHILIGLQFSADEIIDIDIEDTWFQHDDVTCHATN